MRNMGSGPHHDIINITEPNPHAFQKEFNLTSTPYLDIGYIIFKSQGWKAEVDFTNLSFRFSNIYFHINRLMTSSLECIRLLTEKVESHKSPNTI